MRVSEAYAEGRFGLSFELFPPKTPKGEEELFRHVAELMAFKPSYVTCTYGAGGSTRDKTLDIVSKVHQQHQVPVASHLTCVGTSADGLRDYLREAWSKGIKNIVALRGDPPKGETTFRPTEDGLRYANELVALIRGEFPEFGIAVAGYPETHLEALSPRADLDNLKRKVDAGADIVITQLFYNNADFFEFQQRVQALGIDIPIIPGVLPVTNLAQIKRIAALCGAQLPESFVKDLDHYANDADGQFKVGIEYATKQVQELVDAGVAGIHFYVLNKSLATARILSGVSLPG